MPKYPACRKLTSVFVWAKNKENAMSPDQTTPMGSVSSGSIVFAR